MKQKNYAPYYVSFSCNFTPHSGCSALDRVNLNLKKKRRMSSSAWGIRKWNQFSHFICICICQSKTDKKRLRLDTYWQWTKVSREASSERLMVLPTRFCSLTSNPNSNWKYQSVYGNIISCKDRWLIFKGKGQRQKKDSSSDKVEGVLIVL